MRRFAIPLLAIMAFPAMAAAQSQDVPLDLVKAILAGGRSPWDETQWVEIIVGGPPRQWRIEPLSNLRIMGSAAFPQSATVVYAVDGDLKVAEQAVYAQFEAAGWTLPPARPRSPIMESGFVPTVDYSGSEGPRRPLCKGDRAAVINPLDMPSGPRVLRVVYMGSMSAGMCNPPAPRTMRDPWAEAPIPRLEPPAGARVFPGDRSGGSDSFSSDGTAFTTMAVDKLFAHYAEQMRTKGWQPLGAPSVQNNIAAQSFRLKHNNADWQAMLVITQTGDDMRDLQLKTVNLTDVSKRRGF